MAQIVEMGTCHACFLNKWIERAPEQVLRALWAPDPIGKDQALIIPHIAQAHLTRELPRAVSLQRLA